MQSEKRATSLKMAIESPLRGIDARLGRGLRDFQY